jgi:hypothetical protein
MRADEYVKHAKLGLPVPGLVIDSHMHIGEQFDFHIPHYRDVDLLVHELERHGVSVGCIASIPGCLGGAMREGNDIVIDAVKRHPKRFFGWITINPHYPDAMSEELERCYQAGCRGVKIHDAIGMAYEHPNYRVAYEFAAEKGIPILAHTWGGALDKLEPFIKEFPGVRWSFGHSGAADQEKYVRMAKEYENVYLDICYSRSPRGLVEYFVREGVVDKVMFSSDCYFMGLSQQIGRVLFAKITPREKAMILGENARQFFGEFCPV